MRANGLAAFVLLLLPSVGAAQQVYWYTTYEYPCPQDPSATCGNTTYSCPCEGGACVEVTGFGISGIKNNGCTAMSGGCVPGQFCGNSGNPCDDSICEQDPSAGWSSGAGFSSPPGKCRARSKCGAPATEPPPVCNPRPGPRGSRKGNDPFSTGDPIAIAFDRGVTVDRSEDFFVKTEFGDVPFVRTYYSDDRMSRGTSSDGGALLDGVPKPFGSSPTDVTALRWTHNFMGFVDQRLEADGGGFWTVRAPDGNQFQFVPCGNACWANERGDVHATGARLFKSTGLFKLYTPSGQVTFDKPYADGGWLFVSRFDTPGTRQISSVEYAIPDAGSCSPAPGSNGTPYISNIVLAGGSHLAFNYVRVQNATTGDYECVISGVDIVAGSRTPAVEYTYTSAKAGLIASARALVFPDGGSWIAESYTYDGGFFVSRNGSVIVSHSNTDVDAGWDLFGSYAIGSVTASDAGAIACPPNTCCADAYSRGVAFPSAQLGDGTNGSPSLTRTAVFSSSAGGPQVLSGVFSVTESCSGNGCSAGTMTWLPRNIADGGWGQVCGNSAQTYIGAFKDARGNWTVWPARLGTVAGGIEVLATARGVTTTNSLPNESSALERTDLAYTYNGSVQSIVTETKTSTLAGLAGLSSNATTTTTYGRNSTTNLLERVDVSGYSLDLADNLVTRTSRRSFEYDADGRLSRSAGPCAASGTSPCPSSSPSVEHTYYSTGSTFSSGRLATITRRYNAGASGLVTTFADYTALGDPQQVTDENNVLTTYTYAGHQVATRTVGSRTWAYGWENEKLVSIRYPELNQDILCYRATTSPGCSGAWTGRLTSRTRFDSTGSNWSERVEYTYWDDGSLKKETRSAWNSNTSSAEVRFEQTFAANPHGQPSQTKVGSGTGSYSSVRGYDAVGNVTAIGAPYNNAPAFCGSPGSPSSLCTVLAYDRADRLAEVDQRPTTSSVNKACIDYDAQGNVRSVVAGCSSSDTCANGTGASSCTGLTATTWLTDDFGNVIRVTPPGSVVSSTPGVVRMEYDVQGNLIKQQTEKQKTASPVRYVQHTYDQLNRRTKTEEMWSPASQYTVATWSYDDSTSIPDPFSSCGALPSNTKGRLRAVREPVFTRWYQYDDLGRVTKEIRVPTQATDCSGQLSLTLAYSDNGNLTSLTYGHQRQVIYVYGTGAFKDRETSVQSNVFLGDGGTSTRTLLSSILWEPFGGVRSYVMNFPATGNSASLENEVGAAGTAPASSCLTSALSETNDKTGRLRSIRVWDGSTNIYRRTYAWRADQVERIDSCYKGGPDAVSEVYAADAGSAFGYDGTGQLLGGINPTFDTNGGPMRRRQYTYDSRGNLTNTTLDQYGFGYDFQYDGGVLARDRLSRIQGFDSMNTVDFVYDVDGRASVLKGAVDSSGAASSLSLTFMTENGAEVGPGGDTVIRVSQRASGGTGTATHKYYYDASNRRQLKVYPVNNRSDVFLYDLGHQLLEDRGNFSSATATPYAIDEYIWLDGKPVAVYRASLNSSFVHLPDDSGSCSRMGDGVNCGVYFLVTDHIGKPVLVLNGARKIAGAGEYEPYGQVNRTQWWSSTPHPYTKWIESWGSGNWVLFKQKRLGMELEFRVHFPMVDTEQDCGGNVREGPSLWNATGMVMKEVVGGYARGDVWTQWYQPDADASAWGAMNIRWGTNPGNCHPTNCNLACPQPNGTGWDYSGFVMREFEYRRYESGASPYFPPLRYPGQYFDAETDLHENWHRYYFPLAGRYLSPEPMLDSPDYVRTMAKAGLVPPHRGFDRLSGGGTQDG